MASRKRRAPVRLVTVQRAERVAEGATRVLGSAQAAATLQALIGDKDREHVVVLHMDVRHQILAAEVVGIGILTSCLVHPREVYKAAILLGAAAIIVGHNHPSGDDDPSKEDDELMKRLGDAGQILGITLLDFIIVTETRHWSASGRLV